MAPVQVLEAIVARLQSTSGVVNAAFGNALPFVTSGGFKAFKMRPPTDPSKEVDVNAMQRVISPAVRRRHGPSPGRRSRHQQCGHMDDAQVIVVNRSFAARYLGGRAIGAIVPNLGMCRGDNDRWEVVGVVDDMRQGGVTDNPQPELFLPHRQIGCSGAFRMRSSSCARKTIPWRTPRCCAVRCARRRRPWRSTR